MSFLILTLISLGAAPDVSQAEPSRVTTKGAFFAISVADLDAATHWYSEKLDLNLRMSTPKRDGWRMNLLEGDGLIVELIQSDKAVPLAHADRQASRDQLVHGIFKSGVIVENFDALVATLRSRRVPIEIGPFPATNEQRANLIIRDNSGNLIQFVGAYANSSE